VTVHPFIEAEKPDGHNVKRACELLQVSRAAFYARRSGRVRATAVARGATRIRRIARLMRDAGLQGRHRRRRQLDRGLGGDGVLQGARRRTAHPAAFS
jgi:transposase InsO family protein